jgi:O-antigen/teichoic acid export membrane protein
MMANGLMRRTLTMLGGNMAAVVLQAVQFILLARTLGAAEYGAFVAVNALVAMAVPLAGLGYGNVMLMSVSRDRASAPVQLGNSLLATVVMGFMFMTLIVLLTHLLYGDAQNLWLAVVVGASELVLVRASLVAGQFFQAMDQIRRLSLINVSISSCRVLAIGALWLTDHPQALHWALASTLLLTGMTALHVRSAIQQASGVSISLPTLKQQFTEATYFSLGTTAKAAYTDLDKVYLAKAAPAAELGVYTTAYRLVVMAFIPVRSLLDVTASRFFTAGEQGVRQSYDISRKLLRFAVPYGLLIGLALYLFAPLVPWILGPSYAPAADVLRWLSPLPAIQSIHYVLSDALTGAGHQRIRTQIQFVVLAFYAAMGWWLIPAHGWHGAAVVCLVSEGLLALLVVLAVTLLVKKTPPTIQSGT